MSDAVEKLDGVAYSEREHPSVSGGRIVDAKLPSGVEMIAAMVFPAGYRVPGGQHALERPRATLHGGMPGPLPEMDPGASDMKGAVDVTVRDWHSRVGCHLAHKGAFCQLDPREDDYERTPTLAGFVADPEVERMLDACSMGGDFSNFEAEGVAHLDFQLCEALHALATELDDVELSDFLAEAGFSPSPLRTDGRASLDADEDEEALRIIEWIDANWKPEPGSVLSEVLLERSRERAATFSENAPSP